MKCIHELEACHCYYCAYCDFNSYHFHCHSKLWHSHNFHCIHGQCHYCHCHSAPLTVSVTTRNFKLSPEKVSFLKAIPLDHTNLQIGRPASFILRFSPKLNSISLSNFTTEHTVTRAILGGFLSTSLLWWQWRRRREGQSKRAIVASIRSIVRLTA